MKYSSVLQHSEEDCGAACLATIAKHYGRAFSLNHTREVVGTGQLGTTLLGLRRGAEALGFNARAVQATPELLDRLREVPLPAIIHWKGNHWAVLYGQRGRKCILADPGVGIRYLTRSELQEGWSNGIMLLLQPDSRFEEQPDDEIKGFWYFLKRLWPERGVLSEALLLNFGVGVLFLTLPILIQILTDDLLVRGDTQLLTRIVLAIAAMNLIASGLELAQANLTAHFVQRLELRLALDFARQVLRLPLSYYETHRSNEVVSRLQDIRVLNELISQVLIQLPVLLFQALVSLGLMLFYSWKLTAGALVFAAAMAGSTVFFLPLLRQKTRQVIVTNAENQGVLLEAFKGALTLKATSAAPQTWDELQQRLGRVSRLSFRMVQMGIVNLVSSRLFSKLGTIALLWYGSTLVIAQELTIGQLVAFNSLNGNLAIFVLSAVSWVEEFTRVRIAAERFNEVIHTTPETQDDLQKSWAEISDRAEIIFTSLTFHHPGNPNLFSDFSLNLPGGKVIAAIGKSGCGKSTLAKLIAGLYQPQSGNIRYGRYNQQDLSLECLRQQVVLVPQEAYFWSRTIVANFRRGAPLVTFEQIVRACELAGADEFISQLPDKYQTVLGEFGANLSGGQRQKLALARAIVTEAPILILDEATGALDPVSEAQVLDQLLSHRQGKITILISHRPKVIGRADWIVMLEKGKLKIQGPPEALRSLAGEHLDFLDEVVFPSSKGWLAKSSNFEQNGHSPTKGDFFLR